MCFQEIEFPLDRQASLGVFDGLSVCISGDYIVVPEIEFDKVAVYDLTTHALINRFGGTGTERGEFRFYGVRARPPTRFRSGYYTGVCAGRGRGAPTVCVPDYCNVRVCEHTLPDGHCVRVLGVSHLNGPLSADVNDKYIAVSEYNYMVSRVLLFAADAVDDAPPLWSFGGEHGTRVSQLSYPRGVKFSADGSMVHVADCGNNRVLSIPVDGSVATPTFTNAQDGTAFMYPSAVLECSDGALLVANTMCHQVVKIFPKFAKTRGRTTTFGMYGSPDVGLFRHVSGLAFGHGTLIVRDQCRLQLFSLVSTGTSACRSCSYVIKLLRHHKCVPMCVCA